MDRVGVARVLREMGDLLEIGGANPFEVMAFRNGADTVEFLPDDLATRVEAGTLTELQGVGKGLARVITELVREGRSEQHEQMRRSFPERLLDLRAVPGLGPRRIRVLHAELGIGSLEDLEEAARAGRVRALRGFGRKTEEGLLEGVERARRRLARRAGGADH